MSASRVGLMLVNDYPKILEMTVTSLMEHVDWAVLFVNNADAKTIEKCTELSEKYRGKIYLKMSDVIHPEYTKEKTRLYWWRKTRVKLRVGAWQAMEEVARERGEEIGVVINPDSDEMLGLGFRKAFEDFIKSDKRAMALKPVDVFDGMDTIKGWSMAPHCRVYRYSSDIDPSKKQGWRKAGRFYPIEPKDVMTVKFVTVHLPYLFPEYRKQRYEIWKRPDFSNELRMRDGRPFNGLWRLPKDADKCLPSEIISALNKSPDLNVDL